MRFYLEINGEEFPDAIKEVIKRELGRDCVCEVCDDDNHWREIEDELPKIGDDILVRFRSNSAQNTYDAIRVLNDVVLSWVKAQVSHWVKIKAPNHDRERAGNASKN
jgi:hypothetical protein